MNRYVLNSNEEGIIYPCNETVYLVTDHIDELNKLQAQLKKLTECLISNEGCENVFENERGIQFKCRNCVSKSILENGGSDE